MDKITPERRSVNMQKIKSVDTKAELFLRRKLHSLGFRFRVNMKELIGRPDIVFTKRKKIILVHGCFWHQHQNCQEGRMPISRQSYWVPKLSRNVERDEEVRSALQELGFDVLVIWECELKEAGTLMRVVDFISAPAGARSCCQGA